MKKEEAFEKAKNTWDFAKSSDSWLAWRSNAIESYRYYEKQGFINPSDNLFLIERGQRPQAINIIQSLIDNLSGVETQSRYRIAARVDSMNPQEVLLAKALTNFLFVFQEETGLPYKDSLKFKDALIAGIGWSAVYSDDKIIHYDYIDPFLVIPDYGDHSPQFTEMSYVCRKWWIGLDKAKALWGAKVDKLAGVNHNNIPNFNTTDAYLIDEPSVYGDRVLAAEVQFKVSKKFYIGFSFNGKEFKTFDEDFLERNAAKKSEVTEAWGEQILRCIFVQDQILEFGPLKPNVPNKEDFSYIPFVWKKSKIDNTPYGFTEALKSPQDTLNAQINAQLHSIDYERIFIKGELPKGVTPDKIKKTLKDKKAIIVIPENGDIQYQSNRDEYKMHSDILNTYLQLMPKISGVNEEMLGNQTNATSGLAQKIRAVNSVRNNVFAFDSLEFMKKRVAENAVQLFQALEIKNLEVYLDRENAETIILNKELEDGLGRKIIDNNVDFLPFRLYIEETPDYRSSREELKADLIAVLSNPNLPLLLQSPTLMENLLGVREGKLIAEEIAKASQAMAAAQQKPEG